ncbi:hypothetical protein GCM10008171_14930 [Methylopila jiangsuensis]|uniref:ParB/Sulfiredoxin domain-containing protein n=1 Tax=Methylopila jiangsuensis TaxID=586230 RepID=A0A9W6N2R4_9HYPH|nr:hypothetical protein [Methylopila jiangsuensis]MDR6284244.1 hypothetical protein [Methylopila jiangsuensis]GLK76239.1 hypothetical protein GCM10008171_14930 [Methylopila jiangsuensis]
MAIKKLALSALVVNRANDRHGELENETAAIAWLFKARETHMRSLTKDIVEQGEIYEYPLVSPDKSKFIVFDGNRRVTCLKLLDDPRRAPTTELQAFFRDQKALWKGAFPTEIQCQVEADRDRIDEILFRRHTGSQSGVGQSTWDDRMKANFVTRTGKGGGPQIADEIEKRLSEASLLPTRRKIPRSTLNRLLSSEPFRHRVGVSMKGGRFQFIQDEAKSLTALARIAKDMAERDLVLGDIWDIDGKQGYLDKLELEGVLPKKTVTVTTAEPTKSAEKPAKVKPSAKATPTLRTTLIPQKDFDLSWPGRLQRHHRIWEELQFHLDLRTHPNAISVLMRVLIELALENYIKEAKVTAHENDKLATRLEKAGLHLQAAGRIDAKKIEVLKKFKQGEKLVSADTLNKYVHSTNFAPSPEHLMSIWDSLADVIVEMLKV